MREYEEVHRVLAALSFARAGGQVPAATLEFRSFCKSMGLELPKDPSSFISNWGEEWYDKGSLAGSASSSGRPRKLAAEQVQQILDVILQWRADGREAPYESVEQLNNECAVVKAIVDSAGVSDATLICRLKEACPGLRYFKLGLKPKLSKRQRDDRYTTAAQHLEQPDDVLQRVIWIDAKTMHITVKSKYGWALATDEDTYETEFPPSMKNPIKLKYYIAVNYRLGALKMVFYTGTTGMPAARNPQRVYLVSSGHVELGGLSIDLVIHRSHDCCTPSPLAATLLAGVARAQPHHIEASMLGGGRQHIVPAGPEVQAGVMAFRLSVELADVLLSLNLNQNPSWFHHHDVPAMPAQVQHLTLMLNLPVQRICFNSPSLDAFQLVACLVCFLLIAAALALTHPAMQCSTCACHLLTCQITHMLCNCTTALEHSLCCAV
jgi:hypothetical protein